MERPLFIVGPGALGRDMALFSATRGLEVGLVGRTREHAAQSLQRIRQRVEQLGIQSLEAASQAIVPFGIQDAAFHTCGYVYEALPESLAVKSEFWAFIEPKVSSECLLMTGTSSLSLAEVAAGMVQANRLIAFHVFVPIHRSGIAEIATTMDGSIAFSQSLIFSDRLGLHPIHVPAGPGYAATRMGLALGLEAMRIFEEGHLDASEIDRLMISGYGHPLGPLELSDRVGLDLRLSIAEGLFSATQDPRFKPPAILTSKVQLGHLGRKCGKGFYTWTSAGRKT